MAASRMEFQEIAKAWLNRANRCQLSRLGMCMFSGFPGHVGITDRQRASRRAGKGRRCFAEPSTTTPGSALLGAVVHLKQTQLMVVASMPTGPGNADSYKEFAIGL